MKVRIIDNTVAQGHVVVEGQILDLPESEAKILLQTKRAVLFEESESGEPEEATDGTAEDALHEARFRTGRKAGR